MVHVFSGISDKNDVPQKNQIKWRSDSERKKIDIT